jgi:hypothetical protein
LTWVGVLSTAAGCDRFTPAPSRPAAQGPLRVHAANPRYLDDGSGKAILLVGSHTWSNLQDTGESNPPEAFDFDAYLQMLSDHNHNFIRLWRLEPASCRYADEHGEGETSFYMPHPWMRSGPGNARDGKPRFDLARFDESYFDRLRSRVKNAGARGMYVGIMLFEGHALAHAAEAWDDHPFNRDNNINGIDGDTNGDGRGNETHALGNPGVLAMQDAYVRKVIDTVNDLDNVLFEISNESHADSHAWQNHMVDFVHAVERDLPNQHLVIYSIPPGLDNERLWESQAQIVSPGKKWIGDPPQVPLRNDPPATDGSKVVMLDTDHLWGCGGDPAWVFKAFMRGYHPIYMDPWQAGGACGKPDKQMRRNLGYALRYADRVDLARMTPHDDLASSRFCLASPGREYLAYVPHGGSIDIDLRDANAAATFSIEWFLPASGETRASGTIMGGAWRSLRSPGSADALLWLRTTE